MFISPCFFHFLLCRKRNMPQGIVFVQECGASCTKTIHLTTPSPLHHQWCQAANCAPAQRKGRNALFSFKYIAFLPFPCHAVHGDVLRCVSLHDNVINIPLCTATMGKVESSILLESSKSVDSNKSRLNKRHLHIVICAHFSTYQCFIVHCFFEMRAEVQQQSLTDLRRNLEKNSI